MELIIVQRKIIMNTINVKRLGLALGTTLGLLYLGCVFVMSTVGEKAAILFFNSLLHGIDVTSIIRMNMPIWEMIMGVIEVFILGWLTGAAIASVYNFRLRKTKVT